MASFTAIGGFEGTTLGFFNLTTKGFDEMPFHEDQVEVLSLIGDITREEGEPRVHGHVVVGRRDGSTLCGHLLQGIVRPILIVTLTELSHLPTLTTADTPTPAQRRYAMTAVDEPPGVIHVPPGDIKVVDLAKAARVGATCGLEIVETPPQP